MYEVLNNIVHIEIKFDQAIYYTSLTSDIIGSRESNWIGL